jgi:Mrp family chromosome partitioning ATPase
MDLAAIVHRLDVTRARIESEVNVPGVIAITSASRGDGKSLVATGLAHGLAGVGHSVLLVDGHAEAAGITGSASAPKLDVLPFDILQYITAGVRGEPSRLGLTSPGVLASCSLEAVQATYARLRETFEYTIIDTAVLVESGMAVALASECDGIVIAFKQGRAAHDADREFVKLLRASKTPVLGVVTTHAQAVKRFNTARADEIAMNGSRLRTTDDGAKNPGSLGVRLG